MCGICIILHGPELDCADCGDETDPQVCTSHALVTAFQRQAILQRGPDSAGTVRRSLGPVCLHATSSVLHLRGPAAHVTPQPFVDEPSGRVLCFNGEIWHGLSGLDDVNDGTALFHALCAAPDPVSVLSRLEGPWALVYYDAPRNILYYGRDRLGRRSLTERWLSPHGPVVLASVGAGDAIEVPATGLFFIDLGQDKMEKQTVAMVPTAPAHLDSRTDPAMDSVNHVSLSYMQPSPGPPLREAYAECRTRFLNLLLQAMRIRCTSIPATTSSTRLAIMYSGGLDSAVLARLADMVMPENEPIELLNVAFENKRVQTAAVPGSDIYELCPDRVTGRQGFAELCSSSKARPWRFVTINVPYSAVERQRSTVLQLMAPQNTEMDLSIALAFYFVAGGRHVGADVHVNTPLGPCECDTGARVLISGLGADEQLGGYSRHVNAYTRASQQGQDPASGFVALERELAADVARLPVRNLGRDDRVTAHHGRELRFPFLDERVMLLLSSLPVAAKIDPREQNRDTTKLLLREVACMIGLPVAAREKKRAIQFGARTAKMTEAAARAKGHHVVQA